jgi:hypothetical protein
MGDNMSKDAKFWIRTIIDIFSMLALFCVARNAMLIIDSIDKLKDAI